MTKEAIVALIVAYSKIFGVDPQVAVSVAKVESRLEVEATGQLGEVGLFQIRPEFYPMLTKAQIRSPETNIMLGVRMLAKCKKTCIHQEGISWLVCYNYGPGNAEKVRHPSLFPYVRQVEEEMGNQKKLVKSKNYTPK